MNHINLSWSEFKSIVDMKLLAIQYVDTNDQYYELHAKYNELVIRTQVYKDEPANADQTDFETNYKMGCNKPVNPMNPFASKKVNGKSLFNRCHGVEYSLAAGANTKNFAITYPLCKFTGLEIINGELGDKVDLFILDTPTGTVSTIANYKLNQFGITTNIAPDFYKRISNYDADLFQDLAISIEYNSVSAKTVYINYMLHEVK